MTWFLDAGLYVLAGFMDAGYAWARLVFTGITLTLAVILWGHAIHLITKVQRDEAYRARFIVAEFPAAPLWSVLSLLMACLVAEAWLAAAGLLLMLGAWRGWNHYQRRLIAETRIRQEVAMNGRVYH
jgi:hypothetical protein